MRRQDPRRGIIAPVPSRKELANEWYPMSHTSLFLLIDVFADDGHVANPHRQQCRTERMTSSQSRLKIGKDLLRMLSCTASNVYPTISISSPPQRHKLCLESGLGNYKRERWAHCAWRECKCIPLVPDEAESGSGRDETSLGRYRHVAPSSENDERRWRVTAKDDLDPSHTDHALRPTRAANPPLDAPNPPPGIAHHARAASLKH